jgi:hypothetical protein
MPAMESFAAPMNRQLQLCLHVKCGSRRVFRPGTRQAWGLHLSGTPKSFMLLYTVLPSHVLKRACCCLTWQNPRYIVLGVLFIRLPSAARLEVQRRCATHKLWTGTRCSTS